MGVTMSSDSNSIKRRIVLKTAGISVIGGTTLVGAATAQGNGNGNGNGQDDDSGSTDELIVVDTEELELEEDETAEVEVEIEGPPFGRTDVEVTGAPAEPEEFRLEGRNDSESVEIGPVDDDSTVEFAASRPNGDEEVVEVEIEFIQLTFDLPPFGQDQFDLLTDVDLTKGDPETGERESIFGIILEAEDDDGEPLADEEVTFDVEATDHLGTDPFDAAPNDRLGGSTTIKFEDGEGSFSIGGADSDGADLTLGFLGFLPEVNDVETIAIDAPDDVDIVSRTLDLTVNPGTTAVESEWEDAEEEREGDKE